jgi:hypothetical protein
MLLRVSLQKTSKQILIWYFFFNLG